MSLVKIPQIPGVVIGLDGTELMEFVQGGVSKQGACGYIAALANTGGLNTGAFVLITASPAFPNSRGLDVEVNVLELTDEGAQGNITISVADHGITNAKLATAADRTVKGNISGGVASPSDMTLAQLMGAIFSPTNVTAAGVCNVGTSALSLTINKTDGANVVLPAIATKVGPVRIVAEQGTAHPFSVTVTDATIMGLATYPFANNYQAATFYPDVANSVWTVGA